MRTHSVLALHCSGSSGGQWRALAAKLGSAYRVIAPDLSSCGTLAGEAVVLERTLERLGERAHLVGHSYGGALALHLARTRAGLFRSLTLIEPSAFHLLRGGDAIDRAALREITAVAAQVRTALAASDLMGGYGRFVDYWSGPGAWAAMPAEKRNAFAPQLSAIALDFHALLSEPATLDDMRHIALPTLFVQGGCTELPSRCIVRRLRDVIPAAQFRLVQGAGHMLPLTHRDAVDALVAGHIDSCSTVFQQEAA